MERCRWARFYTKFATFAEFEKIQIFLKKNPLFLFSKKPKTRTYLRIYSNESQFTANMLQFGD